MKTDVKPKDLPTIQSTICFLVRPKPHREVLLGFKKSGFGAGKITGIGGKVQPGESFPMTAVREVFEETGVSIPIESLVYMGWIHFHFPARPEWDQQVSLFTTETWHGIPQESSEIKPYWIRTRNLPYSRMWQDAPSWMPFILLGEKIEGMIVFNADNETVQSVAIQPLSIS